MVRVVSGLIVLVALARAASAEEMVRRADTSGRFSVEVPAAWQMQPTEQEVAALNLAGELAGGKRVFVSVYHLGAQDALAQAWHDRDAWVRDERTTRVEVIPGPPPVIHWSYGEGDNRLFEAAQYSVVRRNCIRVHLVCPPDVWPQVQDRLRPIVDSLKAEIDEWPPHPPGFERSEKDGYVWLVQDGVSARELRDLQKLARETERRFEKVHGKLRLDPENPPLLMVCADAASITRVAPDIGKVTYGARTDPGGRRVFLTPLPKEDASGPARPQAAARVWDLLYIVQYGLHYPYWVWVAEGRLEWSETLTGARLPLVTKELHKSMPAAPILLSELLRLEQGEYGDAHSDNGLAYVLFFRAGPAKYRKAWEAFLKDYAATKDATGAIERHLGVLDEEQLRDDLRAWIAKSVHPAKGQ